MNVSPKSLSRNTIKNIIGVLVGALSGYLYYYFIGCVSGTCPLTSNPFISILWGSMIGYLVFDLFKLRQNQESHPDHS